MTLMVLATNMSMVQICLWFNTACRYIHVVYHASRGLHSCSSCSKEGKVFPSTSELVAEQSAAGDGS